MHVFVTGGSGLTGPAIVAELVAAGHTVTGLARSDEAAARLRGLGADTLAGALEDLDALQAGAKAADGVIHMAFGGSFADPEDLIRRDRTAIETIGRALAGSGKPFVSTCGTLVMPGGRVTSEDDAPRKHGVSAYIGDGANRWPAIHRLDAAALFRLALEKAPAGRPLHGAAENVTLRSIAEQVGRILAIPAVSIAPEQAAEHFGDPFMARVFAADAPVSSAATRTLLGWTPTHPTLLEDIEASDYCTA